MKTNSDELLWDVRTPSGLFAEAYQSDKGTFLVLYRKDSIIRLEQDDMVMLLKTLNDYRKKEDEVS